MITTTQMYWLVTLNSIVFSSIIMSVILGVIAFTSLMMALDDSASPWITVILGVVACFFMTVAILMPTTKQMAAIIIVPKIANSEKVQTVGNRLYDLAVERMDELKPARAKEGGAK